jgi:hypothetical protein
VILTDEPVAVEGKTLDEFEEDGEYLFEMLDHDQQEIEQLVWVDYPQSYGFKNDYEFIGNGVSPFLVVRLSSWNSLLIVNKLIQEW